MPLSTMYSAIDARTRVATPENVFGLPGSALQSEYGDIPLPSVVALGQAWERYEPARELGKGWKVRPKIILRPKTETPILDVDGPGIIRHIWITLNHERLRDQILRVWYDGELRPSIEVPVGDFFCNAYSGKAVVNSIPINSNPTGAYNCYFPMPFRRHIRIALENRHPSLPTDCYYAITWHEEEVKGDACYLHAQWRRSNPLNYRDLHCILDGVSGRGHYVGTYLAWQTRNHGWWGEGEVLMWLDGDRPGAPSIAYTGTEDYFGGAWCFLDTFSAPYLGYPEGVVIGKDKPWFNAGERHTMYRFHVEDPISFQSDLKVAVQALGWRSETRFNPLQDDLASVAYWYQNEPHSPFPVLPDRNALENI